MENHNTYETSDIAAAGFLLARGYDLAGVNDENPRHVRFRFSRRAELEEAVRAFHAGEAMVNALQYHQALEEIRSYVWEAKRKDKKEK